MDVHPTSVLAMAEAARWAPSVHNTQPWRFRSRADGLDVLVDVDRTLPALDPTGRLRSISCGAAVANATTASRAAGHATLVRLLPDGPDAPTVARVAAVAPRQPTRADLRMADAIPRRRTHRVLRPHEPVPATFLEDLADTVADEGARLTVLDLPGRRRLAGLTARAVQWQHLEPAVLDETASWLRAPARRRSSAAVDGVLRSSLGAWPYPTGSVVRERSVPPADLALQLDAQALDTTLVVVSTPTDTHRDHVLAGIAMQQLLLHATALGLVAAFADVATQVPATRPEVGRLLPRRAAPQVVLRLGSPLLDVRTPPRRPLADLLDHEPGTPRPDLVDLTSTHERTPS